MLQDTNQVINIDKNNNMIAISFGSEDDLEMFKKQYMIFYYHEKSNISFNNYSLTELFERCNKSHFPKIDNNTYYNN